VINNAFSYKQGVTREYPTNLISSAGAPSLVSGSTWSTSTIATWGTTISGQPHGNGVYRIASAAGNIWNGQMQHPAWLIFDSETQANGPHWGDSNYNNGVWIGGTSSIFSLGGSYYGDWVSLQLPEAISLSSCSLTLRSGLAQRAPSKFRIYGSNDGTSWTVLHDQTSALAYSGIKGSVAVQGPSTYTHIALVVSALPATGTVLNFLKWRIYGRVSSSMVIFITLKN
jgi:hypothetical protein